MHIVCRLTPTDVSLTQWVHSQYKPPIYSCHIVPSHVTQVQCPTPGSQTCRWNSTSFTCSSLLKQRWYLNIGTVYPLKKLNFLHTTTARGILKKSSTERVASPEGSVMACELPSVIKQDDALLPPHVLCVSLALLSQRCYHSTERPRLRHGPIVLGAAQTHSQRQPPPLQSLKSPCLRVEETEAQSKQLG